MSYVSAEGLTKTFRGKPPVTVIDGLDLEIEEGEFLVLLGPSGCGKTTTLRCLAGLESPTSGRISFGGQTVFDAGRRLNRPPEKRSIGMVFQSYALWPHMSVRKNIAYPLRARGLKDKIKEGWVEETARLVDCEPLLDRHPAQLSGGQQQRVALARGLVARPDLVLFDEPLSNLDARLRDSVRAYLHELHAKLRFTAVFVTHDQSEALALGDRLAIMRAGTIDQFDTPRRVFENPATEYVADFVGMSNRLVFERSGYGWTCEGRQVEGAPLLARCSLGASGKVVARLRPEDLFVAPEGERPEPGTTLLKGHVLDTGYGGRHLDATISVEDADGAPAVGRLHARVPLAGAGGWARDLRAGQPVGLGFRPSDARFFEVGGEPVGADAVSAEPVRA
ncbi:ABC transporter ATP-binding protein [Actinomadura sp. SCN-SB]|uniref:ABC transporter ATP-binding protein n=1 Tax=Actinomadura sp. SCN-SB TaxID=3373092 RepID=UPI00375357A8